MRAFFYIRRSHRPPQGDPLVNAPRMLFLGSYPPRECGIATFTKDVVDNFDALYGTRSDVIAIDEPGGEARAYPSNVVGRLKSADRSSYTVVAALINALPFSTSGTPASLTPRALTLTVSDIAFSAATRW